MYTKLTINIIRENKQEYYDLNKKNFVLTEISSQHNYVTFKTLNSLQNKHLNLLFYHPYYRILIMCNMKLLITICIKKSNINYPRIFNFPTQYPVFYVENCKLIQKIFCKEIVV